MPVKELRDFAKVSLQPGETKTVEMRLPRRAFSWYNVNNKQWEADNGSYEIMLDSSSRDIRLTADFELTIGIDPSGAVTADTYIGGVWNSNNPKIQEALKKSGLYDALKPLMADDAWVAISANMPLRSFTATGGDEDKREAFLKALI